ncbi:hypothetical protein PENTCL1PPCAC_29096, partial [Pristionchus entomophagus]
ACLVCSTPNNSLHFGVEACRACSAFFKRATRTGRHYACRRGQRTCDVTRGGEEMACRACRYARCLEVGMVYVRPLRMCKPIQYDDQNESLLARIEVEYEKSIVRRREQELALLRTSETASRLPGLDEVRLALLELTFFALISLTNQGLSLHAYAHFENSQIVTTLLQEVYVSTTDLVHKTIDLLIKDMWSLFPKIFPSLDKLSHKQQVELYRFYLPNFILVDTYFRTWKIWGTFEKYIMCSIATCIDVATPDAWLPKDGSDDGTRSAMVSSASSHVHDQVARLGPCFERAQKTEREVHALLAIMLCETDMKLAASERLLSLLDSIRGEALRDLQRYYREELGMADFSSRLGNLMTICHVVRECSSCFQEFFRMQVTLFDFFDTELLLQEMFI